jgi:MFS family permease
MLVFLLIGGVFADRLPRTRLLVLTHLAASLTQVVCAAWFLLGGCPLAVLLVATGLNGLASAFTGPALRGIVAELVPAPALERANAARSTAKSAFRLAGPTVAGILVAAANAGWALAIDAACLLGAAILLATIRSTTTVRAQGSVLRDLREGWTEFASRRWLWSITAAFFVVNLGIGSIWLVLGPVIAEGTIGPTGWGVVLGVRAGGLVLGGVLAYHWTPRHPLVWSLLLALPLALTFAALALVPTLTVLLPLAALMGFTSAIEGVLWESTLQRQIPPESLSRVASYDMLGSFASVPLGQMLAAPSVLLLGTGPTVLGGAALVAVAVLLPLLVPEVRAMRRETDTESTSC